MDNQPPLWTRDVRRDGVHIVLTEHGFAIVPRDRKNSVTVCPCCGGQIRSVDAAKAIADIFVSFNDLGKQTQ